MDVYVHGCIYMSGTPGGQEVESDVLELELQTVVSCHGGSGT